MTGVAAHEPRVLPLKLETVRRRCLALGGRLSLGKCAAGSRSTVASFVFVCSALHHALPGVLPGAT